MAELVRYPARHVPNLKSESHLLQYFEKICILKVGNQVCLTKKKVVSDHTTRSDSNNIELPILITHKKLMNIKLDSAK